MMNVKCFRCGKSFALNESLVAAWLEEHRDEHPRHYVVHCPFCRRANKVPIQQIERHLPRRSTPTATE